MKWQASVLCVAQFVSYAYAQAICQTIYASTSTSNVPTRTTTKTADVTETSTTLSKVYTKNTTIRPVYISIVGKKTTTVPTGPSFTPLTNAPTQYTTNGPLKSEAAARPAASASASSASPNKTSSYPKSVACSTTTTRTHTTTLTTDATITNTFWSTTVSTSQVATSTAYAACSKNSKNVLSKFHGQDPLLGEDLGAEIVYICDYTPNYGTEGQIDCLSATTCCEGAQRGNYRGYEFYVYMGANHCFYLTGDWTFTTIDGVTSSSVLGNGPSGSGVFQNVTYTD